MQFKSTVATLALAGSVLAQAPNGTSICDYYTTALLKNNTAANQLTVLTLLVNTAVIGNYTKPDGVNVTDTKVTGIVNNGTYNGKMVNLLPYFNGGLASSNRGGSSGVAVNFLDDGGAEALMKSMPANGQSSNQYKLLTHLYQFFGTLLGCSQQGMTGFASYGGMPSMGKVHQFMNLNDTQNSYFIQEVGLAAKYFGVADSDIAKVASALNMTFNYRCAPPTTIAKGLENQTQAICQASDCMLAQNAMCSAYVDSVEPGIANSSLAMGQGNMSSTATQTAANGGMATGTMTSAGAAASTSKSGAAGANVVGSGLAAGLGLLAFLL